MMTDESQILTAPNGFILRWARESAGLSHERVGIELGAAHPGEGSPTLCASERVEIMESAFRVAVSLAHLRQLAELYERPLAVFFMPEIPVEVAE